MFTGSVPSLESFSNLTYLSLSGNNFDRWKPPDWFGKLNKITLLRLVDVNLYGEISSSFFNQNQVRTLDLSRNQLKGQLPSLLTNLQNLESFVLSDWFGKLNKITLLRLVDVNLYGEIPSSFFNQTQVRTLDLSRNQLKGQLPSSLTNLQNLESFVLFDNTISGTVEVDLSLY
ncbi:hypothetical protein L1987_19270 [Smallanthus sonchifolius]|uniref:Uncharacterized protein n=1 Tax=Smallanthus sonchifolius TaxID=185202 RepID=A0ACB9IQ65_9ASTR|nr:hypothetical protein L1987_19270 [Smallanthus sonchifolius]